MSIRCSYLIFGALIGSTTTTPHSCVHYITGRGSNPNYTTKRAVPVADTLPEPLYHSVLKGWLLLGGFTQYLVQATMGCYQAHQPSNV